MKRASPVLLLMLTMTGCSVTSTDCSTLTDTYSNYGQSFMTTNCRNCHQHTSQFGSQASVVSSLNSIESEINSGRMPQDSTLSSTEKARVLAWLSCGAP